MYPRTKKALLGFLIVVLFLPLMEQLIDFEHSAPVAGAFIATPDPKFDFLYWWDGSFQEKKNAYANDNIGFRPDFIRINNQLDYSLFDKLHFSYGLLGPDHCLWDNVYIDSYLGIDYIGYQKSLALITKLKKLQDTLNSLGIPLVMIYAPSKAYYYPELFPAYLKSKARGPANLETFLRLGDSLGVRQLDFNGWLLSLKKKSKEVLYPKQGIHWSVYAAALAADTLTKYIDKIKRVQMPQISWEKINHTTIAQATDDDMSKTLNLITPFNAELFSYPELIFKDEEKKTKLNALYIGDSFMCQWEFLHVLPHINNKWQCWFYFKTIVNEEYPYDITWGPRVKDRDWIADVKKADYIVMLYTAKNLPILESQFIGPAYAYFFPADNK